MAAINADQAPCVLDSNSKLCSLVSDKPAGPLVDGDINKIVERKLRSNNFQILHWSLDSLEETNGYLGQYYSLSITVKINDKSKNLKFFAKTPPPVGSPQYNFCVRSNTFHKEIMVYQDILKRMGNGKGPKWSPDYYFGKSNSVIVLEDATQEGYVTLDKYVPFDLEHCISMVKAISRFHSRALILEEKLRRSNGQNILDLYGHLLEELAFCEDDLVAHKYLSSSATGACRMVDFVEGWTDEERTMVKNQIVRWIQCLPRLLKQSTKYRKLICHRDLWTNNIMFKRDSSGKPIGCYLIDFQFLRYSPPAYDLLTALYLTTDRACRNSNYNSFLRVYYDTMREELADEGLKVEDCFPLSDFLQSCEESKRLAVTYSVCNMQIMLLTKEAVEKYFVGSTDLLENVMYGEQRAELVINQCEAKEEYKTRIVELIEEFKDCVSDYPPPC